ncbi:MAG: SDR family oxidoreductase [Ardenticatenales bacterium]|nr:SDR family oxidoreductase [Ardenticatenales bacterium]
MSGSTKSSLENGVALVTGAGSGIGRATAQAFARAGACVAAADISAAAVEETTALIRQAGGCCTPIVADVTDEASVQAMIDQASAIGELRAACNCAGIAGAAAKIGDYPLDEWNKVVAIDLTGVFLCMRAELQAMAGHGNGGSIINIASIAGHVGLNGAAPYVASKHGVIGLTQTGALEYAGAGVRVNAVAPGFVVTPILSKSGIPFDEAAQAKLASRHPMNRLGLPEEIAEAVVWLASDASAFVTGTTLNVDGGYLAR